MSKWLLIYLEGSDLEEKSSLLFEHGVQGSCIEPDGRFCCYYLSSDGSLSSELEAEVKRLDLKIEETQELEEKNWTQSCDALFEPVVANNLRIIPLRSAEELESYNSEDNSKDILIIPGTGFGTGHHPTTYNLLKLMQDPRLSKAQPKTVLDAGCGSGILAIGAAKLFNCTVDAYEVDLLAVENAEENVSLNKLEKRINLFAESVHKSDAKYDLVIANLYAELLEILCSHLVQRGNPKAHFLLSGIRADLAPGVIKKYESHELVCIEKIVSDGWAALMFSTPNTES